MSRHGPISYRTFGLCWLLWQTIVFSFVIGSYIIFSDSHFEMDVAVIVTLTWTVLVGTAVAWFCWLTCRRLRRFLAALVGAGIGLVIPLLAFFIWAWLQDLPGNPWGYAVAPAHDSWFYCLVISMLSTVAGALMGFVITGSR